MGTVESTVANTYYFSRLIRNNPELPLEMFWSNQQDNGVDMDISGAWVTAHSKNKNRAVKLIE